MKKKVNKLLVSKANLLIDSIHDIDILETRILEMVFSQISRYNDLDFKNPYKVYLPDLNTISKNKTIYSKIEAVVKNLNAASIYLKKPNGDFKASSITNFVEYIKEDSTIVLSLHENLKPYLLNNYHKEIKEIEVEYTQYTNYSLLESSTITSKSSKKIYDKIMQWKSVGHFTLNLDELKKWLIKDSVSTYKDWTSFKNGVLMRAIKALNNNAEIPYNNIAIVPIKIGKSIQKVKFTFSLQNEKEVLKQAPLVKEKPLESTPNSLPKDKKMAKEELIRDIMSLSNPKQKGISKTISKSLIDNYGEPYVRKCIDLLLKEDHLNKLNLAGYVVSVIKNDWKGIKSTLNPPKKTTPTSGPSTTPKKTPSALELIKIRADFTKKYAIYYQDQLDILYTLFDIEEYKLKYIELHRNDRQIANITVVLLSNDKKNLEWGKFNYWLLTQFKEVKILTNIEYAQSIGFKYTKYL